MKIFAWLVAVLSGVLGLVGCATKSAPLTTVPRVDLQRYSGDWRVIANVPYFAEKGAVDSIETYRLRKDGKIDNIFTYRKESFDAPQKQVRGVATVVNTETNAEWRVKFLGLLSFPYYIVALDPDYQWTAIAHPSRKYGWILARDTTLPDSTYRKILATLKQQGYREEQFVKVPQPGK